MIAFAIACTLLTALGFMRMPYSFYVLLRIAFCLAACIDVAHARKRKAVLGLWVFGVMAVLYNPVLPVHLRDKLAWEGLNSVSVVILWVAAFTLRDKPAVTGTDGDLPPKAGRFSG